MTGYCSCLWSDQNGGHLLVLRDFSCQVHGDFTEWWARIEDGRLDSLWVFQ